MLKRIALTVGLVGLVLASVETESWGAKKARGGGRGYRPRRAVRNYNPLPVPQPLNAPPPAPTDALFADVQQQQAAQPEPEPQQALPPQSSAQKKAENEANNEAIRVAWKASRRIADEGKNQEIRVEIESVLPRNYEVLRGFLQPLRKGENVAGMRYVAKTLPHTSQGDLINAIRDRAEAIAGRDNPNRAIDHDFVPIRERIHNHFEPSVLDSTRAYLKTSTNPRAQAELKLLIKDMEILFGQRIVASGTGLENLVTKAEDARKNLVSNNQAQDPVLIVDVLNQAVGELYIALGLPQNLPTEADPLPLTNLNALLHTLHAEGFLKDTQHDEFQNVIKNADPKNLVTFREFLKHVFAVSQAQLEKSYKWARSLNKTDDVHSDFVQRQLRASSLLRLSQWIENLGAIIAKRDKAKGKPAYEASSEGSRCGTLRVVESEAQLEKLATGMKDILAVISDKPVEVTRKTPFGGLIANSPMTEGSHAVILCRNMQRPCGSAEISKEEAARIKGLNGKLVRLDVRPNGYSLKAAKETANQNPVAVKGVPLEKDLNVSGVQNPQGNADAKSIGVKAANYFELGRFLGAGRLQPGIALPFKHYVDFMKQTGLEQKVQALLKDPKLFADPAYRSQKLGELRDQIKKGPMPAALVKELREQIENRFSDTKGGLVRLRFRSSSNSEDLKWFSGAGLYDSAGLSTNAMDPDAKINEGIAESVKAVWASVWSDNAFEGREEVGIDHSTVAMGVLIHPSYDDEKANGVALTGSNPKKPELYKVSVNLDSYSVTNPEMAALPEVYEGARSQPVGAQADSRTFIRRSNVRAGAPVLTPEEAEDLRGMVQKIHDRFNEPMEIEFKLMVDPKDSQKRIIQVKQARPYRAKKAG